MAKLPTTKMLPDLYQAIGAPLDADTDGIAASYRIAARRAHPDAGGSHEQFVAVDLAWRLLRDVDTRRRFDALWRLQIAVQSSSKRSTAEVRQLLDDADAALLGWRLPIELRIGIDELQEESHRWVERIAAAPASTHKPDAGDGYVSARSAQSQRRESEQLLRDSIKRTVGFFRDEVVRDMSDWPDVLDQIRTGGTIKVRRAALSHGYRIYTTLRKLQDIFDIARQHTTLTVDDLRLHFHVSEAVIEVRACLVDTQGEFGRSYSFKNEKWLLDTRIRTRRALDSRSVGSGNPPWRSPEPSPKTPRTAQESAPSHSDGANGRRRAKSAQEPASERNERSDGRAYVAAPHGRRLTAAIRSGWPKSSRTVAVGATVLSCIAMVWLAPEDSLRFAAGAFVAAALIGLAWLLATSADARRLLGLLVVGSAKITWVIVRGLAALTAGVVGLLRRR